MLALIGASRYETLIRRLFSTKGSEAAPLLSPEVQPVCIVQAFEPEMYILRGDRIFTTSGTTPAVAARNACVQLVNPADSGVVFVLQGHRTWINAALSIGIFLESPASALANVTGAGVRARDGRILTISSTATAQFGDLAALPAAGEQVDSYLSFNNDSLFRELECVVAPGQALLIGNYTVNQAFNFDIFWRERSIEQSEESLG